MHEERKRIVFLIIVIIILSYNSKSILRYKEAGNQRCQIENKVTYDNISSEQSLLKILIKPSSTLPYQLDNPDEINPSPGQTQFVDQYLKKKRNGFFIECGAYDGEHLSNTLFLERFRNWTGLLIEPNPRVFKLLENKYRKSYLLNACLSKKQRYSVETFLSQGVNGKVVHKEKSFKNDKRYDQVHCFSLYSILQAIGRMEADFFSLDVEGAERDVLDTIPWDKVSFKIISIEHNKWSGGKRNLTQYMEEKGYDKVTEIKINYAPDLIFVKRNTRMI